MSFLEEIKKKSKDLQTVNTFEENSTETTQKENDNENNSKETTSPLPSFLKSIENGVTLKKTERVPSSPGLLSIVPLEKNNSMMDQILKRQQQIKKGEKVESEISLPKSKKELVVSKEAPKQLLNEKEMNEKWSERLFKKGLFLIYLKLDNDKYNVTLCGCCQEKDRLKLEMEVEQMKKEFQGYSILNSIKLSTNNNKEYAEHILMSENFNKYYIWNPELKISNYSWIRYTLQVIQSILITNKKYQRNDMKFIQRLFELLPKKHLKSMILDENSFMFECLKDTRNSKVLLENLKKKFENQEIKEIAKFKNDKARTILVHSIMNQILDYVEFFAPYDLDNEILIFDLALEKVLEYKDEVSILIAKCLINNNYKTNQFLNVIDFSFFTKEEIWKLYSNSKQTIVEFKDIFLKAINIENIEIIKDLIDQVDKDLNYLDHVTKCKNGYDILKYLIDVGFNYKLLNEDLETPLFNACRIGSEKMIDFLLENDESMISHLNIYGKNPLNILQANGHKKLVQKYKEKYSMNLEACHLYDLSEDVLQYILSYVSNQSKELLSTKLTCSFLYNVVDSEPLWQLDCLTKFGYSHELVCESWKVTNYILKSRRILERFKTSSLKIQPILFSSNHSELEWKSKDPNYFIQNSGTEKIRRTKMLNERFNFNEDSLNEIEKKSKLLNTNSNIVFLPKDIQWKTIQPSDFIKELLEKEKIEKHYLKMFLKSFTKTNQEFIEQSTENDRLLKEFDHLNIFFGESSTKNGDDFMKQKVSGIKWNHYCIISGDYIAVIQVKQAIKQIEKIDYKTLLKPIK